MPHPLLFCLRLLLQGLAVYYGARMMELESLTCAWQAETFLILLVVPYCLGRQRGAAAAPPPA